jgi:hypothetical protein
VKGPRSRATPEERRARILPIEVKGPRSRATPEERRARILPIEVKGPRSRATPEERRARILPIEVKGPTSNLLYVCRVLSQPRLLLAGARLRDPPTGGQLGA